MTLRSRPRAWFWVALVLVLQSAPWSAAAETLIVGSAVPSGGQCALMLARDLGFFKTQDLDVDLVFFDSGTESMQALVGGRVPINVGGASAVVNAALAGADVVLIAGFVNGFAYSLVVVPEIKTPADLKGKAIGVNRFGSSNDFAARLALTRLGLRPDRDVTLLQLGASTARLAAMQARSIQGAVLEPGSLAVVTAARVHRAGRFLASRYPLSPRGGCRLAGVRAGVVPRPCADSFAASCSESTPSGPGPTTRAGASAPISRSRTPTCLPPCTHPTRPSSSRGHSFPSRGYKRSWTSSPAGTPRPGRRGPRTSSTWGSSKRSTPAGSSTDFTGDESARGQAMNTAVAGADPHGRHDLPAVPGPVSAPAGERQETGEQ